MGSALDPHSIIAELCAFHARSPAGDPQQFNSLISARQYLRLYRLTLEQVPPGSRVLDWGCGNGHFAYFLARAGLRTTAYGYEARDEEQSRALRERAGFEWRQPESGDPVRLPSEGGSFAAAFSVGVLEHVREVGGDEIASLREIHRVLKPGGLLICYHLPNRFSLIEAASAGMKGKHHHRYRFTARDIRRWCREVGFDLLLVRRYGILPRNAAAHLPKPLRWSRLLAAVYDLADGCLALPFSLICQNYFFVARRRA